MSPAARQDTYPTHASVRVVLTCRECGATKSLRPYFLLTKMGTLRVQADTNWMVDGNGALCPAHKPKSPANPQRETWSEYDLRAAIELSQQGEIS